LTVGHPLRLGTPRFSLEFASEIDRVDFFQMEESLEDFLRGLASVDNDTFDAAMDALSDAQQSFLRNATVYVIRRK
jgi:hypothetical protein